MQHIAKFMRRTKHIKPYNDLQSGFTRLITAGGADARLTIDEDYIIHKVAGPFRHPKFEELIYVYFCEEKDRSIPNSERRKQEYSGNAIVYCDDRLRAMRGKIVKRFPKNIERRR